jgi:hypothetical protein
MPPDAVTGTPNTHEGSHMRYQARWSNGFWKTFDRERFADVETHPTEKIADERAAELNAHRPK